MKIGAVFPQADLGADVGAIRQFGRAADQLGFDHVVAFDHVLGADPDVHAPWPGPYDIDTTFHEPMVLFGFLAGITQLELVTGVIVLPQRQTALVAKQAAQVDILTGGRLRLGVGVGWNEVEYDSLGKPFSDRGTRIDEQIDLLRHLWMERSVSFEGTYEQVIGAGISPPPIQRPIPVWVGGSSPPAYRRIGRLADGWFPQVAPGPRLDDALGIIADAASAAGRNPSDIGMEGMVRWRPTEQDRFVDFVGRWRDVAATHLCIDTMLLGFTQVEQHIDSLERIADLLGLH